MSRDAVRLVRLFLDKGDGGWTKAELLRPAEWAAEGQKVWLGLPEMGAVGWAEVRAVEPCPPLEEGAGRRVTGWFRHTAAEVWALRIEGEARPLGVTPPHPMWCPDRNAWVRAGELRVGDRLSGRAGPAAVLGLTRRPQEEVVYTLEVDGDHAFRVGDLGLLVHNESAPGFRILRSDQSPGAGTIAAGCVIRDAATIRSVVGNELAAQGSHTTTLGGFYAFLRGGKQKGGAGFQAVTKEPLTRLAVVVANVGQSGGMVAVAIDLDKIDAATVFDLENATTFQQLLDQYPQNVKFFTQLRGEGLVGIDGSIPVDAVRALVKLPDDRSNLESLLQELLQ
jgi:hypothetical protein